MQSAPERAFDIVSVLASRDLLGDRRKLGPPAPAPPVARRPRKIIREFRHLKSTRRHLQVATQVSKTNAKEFTITASAVCKADELYFRKAIARETRVRAGWAHEARQGVYTTSAADLIGRGTRPVEKSCAFAF